MKKEQYIKIISDGAINYLRILGAAKNMIYHKSDIEWISPQPNTPGPALVFNTMLNTETADERIKAIITEISTNNIPSFWFITPIASPKNIIDILIANGFPDNRVPDDSDVGEPAMALDLQNFKYNSNNKIHIKEISDFNDFKIWISIVNNELHGKELLLAENNIHFLSNQYVTLYLAYLNDIPVATAATMKYGCDASLEFMSTKKEYQRKGIASDLCIKGLNELKSQGIRFVTLRSSDEGRRLYEKLGFKKYFNTNGLRYKN